MRKPEMGSLDQFSELSVTEYLDRYRREWAEYSEGQIEGYKLRAERAERERDVALNRFLDEAKRNAEMSVELARLKAGGVDVA